MNESGIGTYVRYWLHYNNLASSFYKQYCSAKKIKDDYEKQVIDTLKHSGMENANIQIGGGGHLKVTSKREPSQLSLTSLEDLLHKYHRQKGGRDETAEIMTFIRANRGYSMNTYLKQYGPGQLQGQGQGQGQKQLQ